VTQQQAQKMFLPMLEQQPQQPSGQAAPQNSTTSNSSATPTSQLMQQLTQPLDVKPPVNNNPPSSVSKSTIPNAMTQVSTVTKTEIPQPSPSGNNNKSNINLNHMSQPTQPQQAPILAQNQSLLNLNIPNTAGNGMQSSNAPSITTPTPLMQQQLTITNNTNPKHQQMNNISTFVDPLEHSLASLEQPQMNNSQKGNPQDMNAMLLDLQKQHMLMNLNHMPGMNQTIGPNGFGGGDFNGANGVNNLMNMLGMPQMDPQSLSFLNQQIKPGRGFPEAWPPGNNPMMQSIAAQQQVQQQQQQQKQEKIMLTPKPIEELLMNPNDKSKGSLAPPAFTQAFTTKYEPNLKNASSWSQLAAAGSPQNTSATTTVAAPSKAKVSSDTFQEYRTKAKEQAQRQKQEQEKMKKQKEQQELKRQQESLQKTKVSQSGDDLSNGHR
jgi:bromodomain-containing protein 4